MSHHKHARQKLEAHVDQQRELLFCVLTMRTQSDGYRSLRVLGTTSAGAKSLKKSKIYAVEQDEVETKHELFRCNRNDLNFPTTRKRSVQRVVLVVSHGIELNKTA